MNHKRIERLWRREGLKVPARQPKRRRLWLNDGSCVRLRPAHKEHVWSYDFVHTRTHDGRPLRMLTLIDEFTREYLAIDVERRMRSEQVLERLSDLFVRRGVPAESEGRTHVFRARFRLPSDGPARGGGEGFCGSKETGLQAVARMPRGAGRVAIRTTGVGWWLRRAWLLLALAAGVGLSCDGPVSEQPIDTAPAASREQAIERTPVRSSALRSVGYDQGQRVLEIEFTNGAVYQYFDVPAEVYGGLMAAESHGRYFNQAVRNARYRHQRMN